MSSSRDIVDPPSSIQSPVISFPNLLNLSILKLPTDPPELNLSVLKLPTDPPECEEYKVHVISTILHKMNQSKLKKYAPTFGPLRYSCRRPCSSRLGSVSSVYHKIRRRRHEASSFHKQMDIMTSTTHTPLSSRDSGKAKKQLRKEEQLQWWRKEHIKFETFMSSFNSPMH